MKRSHKALLTAGALAAATAPIAASAVSTPSSGYLGGFIEVGKTASPISPPSCPAGVSGSNCTIILTETTALETLNDGVRYPTTITKSGRIVAVTLGLARLSNNAKTAKRDIAALNGAYGGSTQAAITVLNPGPHRRYTVVAESPLFHLQRFLGHTVTFPLTMSLPVAPGQVLALTVPTWAPVLSINLPAKKFSYRASRTNNCTKINLQSAQIRLGDSTQYRCFYTGTRVQYTATEVVSPPVPKDAIP